MKEKNWNLSFCVGVFLKDNLLSYLSVFKKSLSEKVAGVKAMIRLFLLFSLCLTFCISQNVKKSTRDFIENFNIEIFRSNDSVLICEGVLVSPETILTGKI